MNKGPEQLYLEFKCTDANEDGIFENTPLGSMDTYEFSQFIQHMEEHKISSKEFHDHFRLPIEDSNNGLYDGVSYYYDGTWVVVFDGDVHFVYSV